MISKKELEKHVEFLKKDVFFVKNKWPHFELLFKDLNFYSKEYINKNVLFLERTGLYGDISLFAPLFFKSKVTSIDCSSKVLAKRGAYNKKFVKNDKILKWPTNKKIEIEKLNFHNKKFDLIVIPNLIHHVRNQNKLFQKCYKFLKKGGKLYIFEPLVRELHQQPEDYLRYTPNGLSVILNNNKFKTKKIKNCGGPFSVVAYCLDQAIQYLPENKKKTFYKNFKLNDFKKLIYLDKKYKKNLVRKNTSFPMSYSLLVQK